MPPRAGCIVIPVMGLLFGSISPTLAMAVLAVPLLAGAAPTLINESAPSFSIRRGRPQVDRLRDVRRLDALAPRQVGDGARQL